MKISFILPIYKVEAFLRQCVESLTCQTYRDIEIILVDDGSPDGSPALCDQLATEDYRIRVLHKENGGLSDARNAGLIVAKGDYVIFVDSDDFWVGEDSLQKLVYTIISNPGCQFYNFNCSYYYPNSGNFTRWKPYSEALSKPVDGSSAIHTLVASGTVAMSACLKAINRQWLSSSGVTFKKGQIAEDIPWFINLLEKCEKCMFVNEYIYAYRQNVSGSITNSAGERSFNSLLEIFTSELSKIDNRSFTEEAKDAIRSFLAYEYSILLSSKRKTPEIRKELYKYKYILGYTLHPKVRRVSLVYKMFGIKITEMILFAYQIKRKKKS